MNPIVMCSAMTCSDTFWVFAGGFIIGLMIVVLVSQGLISLVTYLRKRKREQNGSNN